MARGTMSDTQKNSLRESAARELKDRQQAYDERFICGDWAIFDGDGMNFYLQPKDDPRDNSAQRTFWNTFEAAVEFGLLPRLIRDADKRTAQSIIKSHGEAKERIMEAIHGWDGRHAFRLKT